MNKLPRARSVDIVVQPLGKEILVYDLSSHKAYNLNETAAAVYQACDGATSFDDLKRRRKYTDDLIFLALDQLAADNLVESMTAASPLAGMTRREAVRRVGLASLVALPVISSLVAPSAASASSLTNNICTTPGGVTCANDAGCAGVGFCNNGVVLDCACILNCCVECSVGTSPAACAGVCVDLDSSTSNCGACGNVCTRGICLNGNCILPA